MRVVSLNGRQGLRNSRNQALLVDWLKRHDADVAVLQEPWKTGAVAPSRLGDLQWAGGNALVAAYSRRALEAKLIDDRWLLALVGDVAIHGVYFPAASGDSAARAARLAALTTYVENERSVRHVVVGDFNLAPTTADGVYNGQPSGFTSRRERDALAGLLAAGNLVDVVCSAGNERPFTFVREIRGRTSKFRCDLALVDCDRLGSGAIAVSLDHSVRDGSVAFTDHSAVIVDLKTIAAMPPSAVPAEGTPDARKSSSPATRSAVRAENTAIARKGPSAPVIAFCNAFLAHGARVLDFGCGFGEDVTWLRRNEFDAVGYDVGERFPAEFRRRPTGRFDAVILNYVVNVLPRAGRRAALRDAWSFVAPGGVLLVTSRTRALDYDAEAKSWPSVDDGHWSNEARGMFQKGHSVDELLTLCAGLDEAWLHAPRFGATKDFSAIVVRRAPATAPQSQSKAR